MVYVFHAEKQGSIPRPAINLAVNVNVNEKINIVTLFFNFGL